MRGKMVEYRGVWLMSGSAALELYQAGKMKALDDLMRDCEIAKAKLEGRKPQQ